MLTNPKLRSQVDTLWGKFWTGDLANPKLLFVGILINPLTLEFV